MRHTDWDIPIEQSDRGLRAHESVNSEVNVKRARLDRDIQLKAMVEAKDAMDPEFTWSWKDVNGTVRVTISPRG